MAFSMAGGGPSNPQINVTPLIDVLLVLIIVFMVVVSMSKTKGLDAQIPQPTQDNKNQPVPVDGTICKAGCTTSSRFAPSESRSYAAMTTWISSMLPMSSTSLGKQAWIGWDC